MMKTMRYRVRDTRRREGAWGCWTVVDPWGGRLVLCKTRAGARIAARNLNGQAARRRNEGSMT